MGHWVEEDAETKDLACTVGSPSFPLLLYKYESCVKLRQINRDPPSLTSNRVMFFVWNLGITSCVKGVSTNPSLEIL